MTRVLVAHVDGFGFGVATELTEGEWNENAVKVFSQGQCHALALALHHLTGWPLVEVSEGEALHYAVALPGEDLYLDALGWADEPGVGWPGASVNQIEPDAIQYDNLVEPIDAEPWAAAYVLEVGLIDAADLLAA